MTAAVASSKNHQKRDAILRLLETTELNTIVIDVLEDTPMFYPETKVVVEALKKKGVWCIARLVTCLNNDAARKYPGSVITRNGTPWSCGGSKGLDPGSRDLWNYMVDKSKEAIQFGFDELQYDYIRFQSDCRAREAYYPYSHGRSRRDVMREFFEYLTTNVRASSPSTPLAVDVFGEAVLQGAGEIMKKEVGQFYGDIVDYFDIICPMVYPSHYAPGSFGVPVPNAEPYKVIHGGLEFFADYLRTHAVRARVRPWLQYFSVCNYAMTALKDGTAVCKPGGFVDYNEHMIFEERRAIKDLTITGFMYWNARNIYNQGGIRPKQTS